jgi:hypothetical protein
MFEGFREKISRIGNGFPEELPGSSPNVNPIIWGDDFGMLKTQEERDAYMRGMEWAIYLMGEIAVRCQ